VSTNSTTPTRKNPYMLKARALQENFSIYDKKIQMSVNGIVKTHKTRVSLHAGRKSGFPCFLIF